jgi:hypothetical protein
MPKVLIDDNKKTISVSIPLTANSGKIRIKNRSTLNEYGITFATKQNPFKLNNYVEWMIGYDVIKKDTSKLAETTLPETQFIGANMESKALYELSEYIYHFYKWGIIQKNVLIDIETYLNLIADMELLNNNPRLKISRDNFVEREFNGIKFNYTLVKYPLLVREFDNFQIVSEIKITEQQRAMATQPMLYLCFPIKELRTVAPLIGRTATVKEIAYFDITKNNVNIFLEVLKMFGILSESHKHDVLEIIKLIKCINQDG